MRPGLRTLYLASVLVMLGEVSAGLALSRRGMLVCGAAQIALPGLALALLYGVYAYSQARRMEALVSDPGLAHGSRDSLLAVIGVLDPSLRGRFVERYVRLRGATLLLLAAVTGLAPLVTCQPRLLLPLFVAAMAAGALSALMRARLLREARSAGRR